MSTTIIDPCKECGRSTAFGSGLFVNRLPADGDTYLCPECLTEQCDKCGADTLEPDRNSEYDVLCEDCSIEEEEKRRASKEAAGKKLRDLVADIHPTAKKSSEDYEHAATEFLEWLNEGVVERRLAWWGDDD